jgi:hypothetical protein
MKPWSLSVALVAYFGFQVDMQSMLQSALSRVLHSRSGCWTVRMFVKATQHRVFSPRTVSMMGFDLLRLRARMGGPTTTRKIKSQYERLHVGCGNRRVPGWLNVDVAGSEFNVDLASGALPWIDSQFSVIAAQQVIEHLELTSELLTLLTELRRVSKPDAEIWLACPDLGKVCAAYAEDKGAGLIDDRLTRPNQGLRGIGMEGVPPQHMINILFHQDGEHRNLLDLDLACWALQRAGFGNCEKVNETGFLERFPDFPPRNDDRYCLYVRAFAV